MVAFPLNGEKGQHIVHTRPLKSSPHASTPNRVLRVEKSQLEIQRSP
jgi:hypothetical protein